MLGFGAMAALNCKAGVDIVKAAQHKHFGLQVFGVCMELAKDIPAGLRRLKESARYLQEADFVIWQITTNYE